MTTDTRIERFIQDEYANLKRWADRKYWTDPDDVLHDGLCKFIRHAPNEPPDEWAKLARVCITSAAKDRLRKDYHGRPPAGHQWYVDPYTPDGTVERFFDGRRWTEQCRLVTDRDREFTSTLDADHPGRLRPRATQHELPGNDQSGPELRDPDAADDPVAYEWDIRETMEWLRGEASDEEMTILWLRFGEGETQAAVAARLGLSRAQVFRRERDAIARLRSARMD